MQSLCTEKTGSMRSVTLLSGSWRSFLRGVAGNPVVPRLSDGPSNLFRFCARSSCSYSQWTGIAANDNRHFLVTGKGGWFLAANQQYVRFSVLSTPAVSNIQTSGTRRTDPFNIQQRGKRKDTKSVAVVDDDVKEEDTVASMSDAAEEADEEWKTKTIYIHNTKIENILKEGLSTGRQKVEDAIVEGRVRVNGEKTVKRGVLMVTGDQIDMIASLDPENPDNVIIGRVICDEISDVNHKGKISANCTVTKKISVENYKEANKYTTAGSR